MLFFMILKILLSYFCKFHWNLINWYLACVFILLNSEVFLKILILFFFYKRKYYTY